MSTKGYIFKDDREEGYPYVLFMEGLDVDEDEGGRVETVEARAATLGEIVVTTASVFAEAGTFDLELGEPDSYAAALANAKDEVQEEGRDGRDRGRDDGTGDSGVATG